MVQEVICLNPELQVLRFGDLKVLKQSEIRVEVPRPVDCRQNGWAVLSDYRRRSETAGIDVLVCSETRRRIASHQRVELHCVGAKDRLVTDTNARARNRHATHIQMEVAVLVVAAAERQVGSALNLRDARELPSVHRTIQE